MNCFLVKDIVDDTQHIYQGKRTIGEYANYLVEKNNISDAIISLSGEKKNEGLLSIHTKILKRGYIYDYYELKHLYNIEKIKLVFDEEKVETRKIKPTHSQDPFVKELKEVLSKRLKNKID